MTELIVEIAKANLGRTDTTDKVNFEYNRHNHNQLRQLIELLQPFQDASHTTPAELQGLVMHRINAQIADGSKFGSDDSTDSKLWHVLHTKFDWFCDFRDLLVELLVTMMKYKAAGPRTWDRRKRHTFFVLGNSMIEPINHNIHV